MARHMGSVVGSAGWPTVYQGQCACGARGPTTDSRADADSWVDGHLRQVEQALAHRRSQPTLEDQARYYREQADNVDIPAHERVLWAGLAEELEHRLGQHRHDSQDQLF